MKATGIVRRIDDLGRVVIPKEIRRNMRIRECDPSRIHTDIENLGKAILNIINRYNSKAEWKFTLLYFMHQKECIWNGIIIS